jgi:hypothetical protein
MIQPPQQLILHIQLVNVFFFCQTTHFHAWLYTKLTLVIDFWFIWSKEPCAAIPGPPSWLIDWLNKFIAHMFILSNAHGAWPMFWPVLRMLFTSPTYTYNKIFGSYVFMLVSWMQVWYNTFFRGSTGALTNTVNCSFWTLAFMFTSWWLDLTWPFSCYFEP